MKLGHIADEIKYTGDKELNGFTFSAYMVRLENRPVMEIMVHAVTGAIGIRKPGDTSGEVEFTAGTAQHCVQADEDVDGIPTGLTKRIDERTVYSYVLPRLHVLIARLYVPRS
jgi:hypothetical protein